MFRKLIHIELLEFESVSEEFLEDLVLLRACARTHTSDTPKVKTWPRAVSYFQLQLHRFQLNISKNLTRIPALVCVHIADSCENLEGEEQAVQLFWLDPEESFCGNKFGLFSRVC